VAKLSSNVPEFLDIMPSQQIVCLACCSLFARPVHLSIFLLFPRHAQLKSVQSTSNSHCETLCCGSCCGSLSTSKFGLTLHCKHRCSTKQFSAIKALQSQSSFTGQQPKKDTGPIRMSQKMFECARFASSVESVP